MDKQKQIEEMVKVMENWAYRNGMLWHEGHAKSLAEALVENGYEKIPEGAVVLTDKELNEELDTIKCAMIVHDDDGKKYVSLDDYNEYTERLGKLARQRKVRIEQLEKLLDDRCDHCIERERKETAEKFAEMANKIANNKLEFYGVRMIDIEDINEICKELIGDK